jgi:hypothetical protein
MLMGVYGDVGSGKTILGTEIVFRCPKIPVYSNVEMKLPNYHPLEITDIFKLEPSETGLLMFIDEAYSWIESRASSSDVNKYVSYIGFQSRKRDLDIVCTAQLRSSLDLRFRDMETISVFCFDRPKPKTSKEDFRYRFVKGLRYHDLTFPYKKAKKLFPLYNTNKVIMPFGFQELEAKIQTKEPISLNQTINDIIELIKHDNNFHVSDFMNMSENKITHSYCKNLLASIEKPQTFEPFVYERMRSWRRSIHGLRQ